MITKVKRLKNIGKFYNYSARGAGLDWGKNTFLLAPNAYGKSTLVDVLRSLQANDQNIILARRTLHSSTAHPDAVIGIDQETYVFQGGKWEKNYSAIQIFDVPYIHTNILSREIGHEHRRNIHRIIIGAKGVGLAEELAVMKTREKNKRRLIDKLTTQFKEANIFYVELADFLAIPASEETAVAGRIQKLEQDILSKENEIQLRALSYPNEVSAPTFDLSKAMTLASEVLAATHEAAEKRVLEHVDKNIKHRDNALEFIRQGLELMHTDCPFCGQDLKDAANLLQAYSEFFDDAFRTYQRNLKESVETLNDWNLENDLTALVSLHNANMAVLKQWEPFIGAKTFPDTSAFVETVRTRLIGGKADVLTELLKKQRDPDAPVDLRKFEEFSDELALLKETFDSYNLVVTTFNEKAKNYVANLPKSEVNSIRTALAKDKEIEQRFSSVWKKWADEYETAKKDASGLLAQKETKQKELDDYSLTIFDKYQKRINQLLVTFGADFLITDLAGKTDERANEPYSDFGILILNRKVPLTARHDDTPCIKNTLSEGDKGALAFAFFIAALEKMPDLDKQIVIFDDPLSSLDQTRREATVRVLLELSPKLNQLCVFTHKEDFLWMLVDRIPNNVVLKIRSDKNNGSGIERLDVKEYRRSEHVQMVEDMKRYTDEDFGPTTVVIQGNIRKIFEIVLKTKYYHVLAQDITEGKGLGNLFHTVFSANLLDENLKHRILYLCGLTNDPHHGGIVDAPSKNLTRDELIPLIGEAFELLEKV